MGNVRSGSANDFVVLVYLSSNKDLCLDDVLAYWLGSIRRDGVEVALKGI